MSRPSADAASTQFLPRIDPRRDAPARPTGPSTPARPPYPPRRPEPLDATQHIPVIRQPPNSVETTQHIPAIRPVYDVPSRQVEDEYDEYDTYDDYDQDYDDYAGPTRIAPRGRAGTAPGRTRRRRVLLVVGVLAVLAMVGAGVAVGSPSVAQKLGLGSAATTTTAPPAAPVEPSPDVRAAGDSAPRPSNAGVNTQLSPLANNPALGSFAGTVLDASTGDVLWDHTSGSALVPASTNKLLTSSAALLALDPQSTLTTKVVAGAQPGTVVLVGGGDPTLSSLPAGKQSVYPGAARLDDLVAQVKAKATGPISKVVVDLGQFSGPQEAPGWDPGDVSGGNYAPIVSAMMDGGRQDPTAFDSPRTGTPAQTLGQALATRLGISPSAVSLGTAPDGAATLGEVHSASVQDLVANLLEISDNVLAEELARAVARADGKPQSFAGATDAVKDVLSRNGFDTTGINLSDSSGLSTQDRVTARLLASVLRVASAGDGSDPRTAKLRPLLAGLPVGGGSGGTLSGRYLTGAAAVGKGWVRAKTGTLTSQGANTLAGVVLDQDGRLLVFALMSNGSDPGSYLTVQSTLDTMAAQLRGCGCR